MTEDKKPSNLEAFITTVAHDLRAPLSAIHLSASLILQDTQSSTTASSNERTRQRIGIIQRQVAAMIRMVTTFLDAEKISLGKLPINKKEVDAVQDVLEILDEFISVATYRHILLDAYIPEKPLLAYYDKDRIRQVLGNLVSNALKFANEGTACTLAVRKDKDSDWIRFEIVNSGDVIPEDKREFIFGRGETFENDLVSSGLGLWIARWIVHEHGGKIWVEPAKGEISGNMFCFVLPCRPT